MVDFGGFLIGEHGIDNALVKSQLAPVRGDFEHIVHFGFDLTAVYLGGALRESFHHFLLNFRRLGSNGVVLHLRGRQVELVCGLDVGNLFEHIHQFREVEELGKARSCPVAGSLGERFVKMFSAFSLN